MPELDGFETAALIKQRERTRHIPIIFVTAISKDEQQVFRGYSAGAVDYVFKPFSPEVLRSKVAVFIELHEKTEQLQRQAELLKEQELAELRRESEERYRFLAEAQPDQIWTAMPNGELDYVNQRVLDYFEVDFADIVRDGWTSVVHPDDLPRTLERWQRSLDTGAPYQNEVRMRRAADGAYRWHLTRALPMRDRTDAIVKWFGSHTDIDDQKRVEESQRFLVEAGAALASSLDYRQTLTTVAKMAIPDIADWVRVDMLEDGRLRTLAVEHTDPAKDRVRVRAGAALPGGSRRHLWSTPRSAHRRERAHAGDLGGSAGGARRRRSPSQSRARARSVRVHVRAARRARANARRDHVCRRRFASALRAGRSGARRGACSPRRRCRRQRAALPRGRGARTGRSCPRDRRRRRVPGRPLRRRAPLE